MSSETDFVPFDIAKVRRFSAGDSFFFRISFRLVWTIMEIMDKSDKYPEKLSKHRLFPEELTTIH